MSEVMFCLVIVAGKRSVQTELWQFMQIQLRKLDPNTILQHVLLIIPDGLYCGVKTFYNFYITENYFDSKFKF